MVSPFQPNPQSQSSSPFDPPSAPRAHTQKPGGPFLGSNVAGESTWMNKNKRNGRSSDLSDSERNKPPTKPKNPFLKNLDSSLSDGNGGGGGGGSNNRFANKKRGADGGVAGGPTRAAAAATMTTAATTTTTAAAAAAAARGGGGLGRKGGSDSEGNPKRSRDAHRMPRLLHAHGNAMPNAASSRSGSESRPGSASSMSSFGRRTDDHIDAFAKKVFECLRKDGISPPAWPSQSQPNNPRSKADMAKFREQYEEYRKKARTSLTKAMLIDDPDRRKTLEDAIDFRGICEDMCPEYEKITRITEHDVPQPEKDPNTSLVDRSRMVKKLARSAAGQEAPLPMDVRSTTSLRLTLDYLIDDLLQDDENLPTLHGFLWDRTRAIRRDFTFLSTPTLQDLKIQAYVLENIVRFHVTSLHLLSQEGKAGEDFVEQQELEQLGKALLSLRDLYDDCGAQGIQCENEAEFRAYYLIFHANDSNTLEMLQRQWKSHFWRDSDEIRTAVSLVEALQNTVDFHGPLKHAPTLAASNALLSYFRIVESSEVSYIMACFAECHFPQLRRSILRVIRRAMARPKDTINDVTAETLNRFLRFDTIQQAIDFATIHDIEVVPDPQAPLDQNRQILLLNNKGPMLSPRLQHQFSQNIVERKRGGLPLPHVIHGVASEPVPPAEAGAPAEPRMVTPQQPPVPTTASRPSPFASANPTPNLAGMSSASTSPFGMMAGGIKSQPGGTQPNPFAPSTPSASIVGNPAATNPFSPAPFGTTAAQSPFAPTQPPASPPVMNPFASSKPAAASSTPALQAAQPAELAQPQSQPSNPFAGLMQPPATGTASASTFSFGPTEKTAEASLSAPSATAPSIAQPFPSESKPTLSAFTFGGAADSAKQTAPNPFFAPPSTSAQPSTGASLGASSVLAKPSLSPASTPKPGSALGSQASTGLPKPTPTFSFPSTGPTPSKAPASLDAQVQDAPSIPPPSLGVPSAAPDSKPGAPPSSAVHGSLFPTPNLGKPAPSTTPPTSPPRHPQLSTTVARRPRDLLGDFTKWFVLGDNGLLHEFEVFMVERLVSSVYDQFTKEEAEKKRKEKERQDAEEATRFRTYNLQVKYFYAWKQKVRERRLRELRRSGREQFKAFREAQRAARQKEADEAAKKAAQEQQEMARIDRSKEMASVLRKSARQRQTAEEALLASGVLSGMHNEREAAAKIVRREQPASLDISSQMMMPPPPPSVNGDHNYLARSRSGSIASTASVLGGSKTRALREELRGSKTERFRRSLPSFSPDGRSTPERTTAQASRVSERWRLKAMGIVQMPDGTALPESMVSEIRQGMHRQERASTAGRRASLASSTAQHNNSNSAASGYYQHQRPSQNPHRAPIDPSTLATAQKRKRPIQDDGTQEQSPKRGEEGARGPSESRSDAVLSEAEILIRELRAMRHEVEEGTTWFKAQNGRLQSEAMSRESSIL